MDELQAAEMALFDIDESKTTRQRIEQSEMR